MSWSSNPLVGYMGGRELQLNKLGMLVMGAIPCTVDADNLSGQTQFGDSDLSKYPDDFFNDNFVAWVFSATNITAGAFAQITDFTSVGGIVTTDSIGAAYADLDQIILIEKSRIASMSDGLLGVGLPIRVTGDLSTTTFSCKSLIGISNDTFNGRWCVLWTATTNNNSLAYDITAFVGSTGRCTVPTMSGAPVIGDEGYLIPRALVPESAASLFATGESIMDFMGLIAEAAATGVPTATGTFRGYIKQLINGHLGSRVGAPVGFTVASAKPLVGTGGIEHAHSTGGTIMSGACVGSIRLTKATLQIGETAPTWVVGEKIFLRVYTEDFKVNVPFLNADSSDFTIGDAVPGAVAYAELNHDITTGDVVELYTNTVAITGVGPTLQVNGIALSEGASIAAV